jgi:hypothetical protein
VLLDTDSRGFVVQVAPVSQEASMFRIVIAETVICAVAFAANLILLG